MNFSVMVLDIKIRKSEVWPVLDALAESPKKSEQVNWFVQRLLKAWEESTANEKEKANRNFEHGLGHSNQDHARQLPHEKLEA